MSSNDERGSILTEAIVAVAILSVTLALVLNALAGHLRATAAARQKELAISLLASRIEEIGAMAQLAEGASEGRLSDALNWRLSVSRIPHQTPSPADAYLVVVKAHALQGQEVAKLETILLKPRQP